MKRFFVGCLLLALVFPCVAQNNISQGELNIFDQWLDSHKDVRRDLTKNPNLIDNPTYLKDHPHFKAYLNQHPKTRDAVKANPSAFMQREQAFEKSENTSSAMTSNTGITKSELRNWDAYLDKHTDVRADLTKNPHLIDNPTYLKDHPHLRAFLDQHPNTRRELREHPETFMNREKGYEQQEKR